MSEYDRAEVRNFHGDRLARRLVRIAIGIDLEAYRPSSDKNLLREELGFSADTVVFVVFRRLAPRMGLENLIDAFASLPQGRRAVLLIGGKGELREALEHRIALRGVEQSCRLLGFVDDRAKLRYLQAADFFVLPTEELEGFGIVILEALACNLPVLGTPAGAIPEILLQLGPEYVARDTTAQALAERLKWGLENRDRLRGSTEFRRYVEKHFDWNDIAASVEQVIREDRPSSPPSIAVRSL
jgi:glycosyltransferase involved in cell wall biosynthesis